MNRSPKWVHILLFILFLIGIVKNLPKIESVIVPPPWGDPAKNPCASQPGGWQLLYWAPLEKCFRIFQLGYPCPDTMELSPFGTGSSRSRGITGETSSSTAECRCPPGTAQSPITSKCHTLFEQGPCEIGQYFAPRADSPGRSNIPKKRWGLCRAPDPCIDGMIFWPPESKCYTLMSRGPCPKGKLLTIGNNGLAQCKCENKDDLATFFYTSDESCHELYTKGPCQGLGELFLPGGKCGCHSHLPHYHDESEQCYEIGSIGPCPSGHIFIVAENNVGSLARATCQCKEGHVLWKDGYCYRLYTQGPCELGEFLLNATTCIQNPCAKGRLYFPEQQTCYRIGSQGPCTIEQVVVFDFTTRPSIDGISYNGVCGCSGIISNLDQTCNNRDSVKNACESSTGMVELSKGCYKLYTRGPCGPGEWLEPSKNLNRSRVRAKCECKPGYTPYQTENGIRGCHAPSVGIARYLNRRNHKTYRFGFRHYPTRSMTDSSEMRT